jgi:hypothetical protein
MKYIKSYEDIRDELKIGDYVICEEDYITDNEATEESIKIYEKAIDFTSKNVGKYIGKEAPNQSGSLLIIQYENVPLELKAYFSAGDEFENCRNMYYREIVDYSSDKEYLILRKDTHKYNI